jgi:hypothetical protein
MAWTLYPRGRSHPLPSPSLPVLIGYEPTSRDEVERRKCCCYRDSNFDPSALQSVASRSTECTIPVPLHFIEIHVYIQNMIPILCVVTSEPDRLDSYSLCCDPDRIDSHSLCGN